MAGIIAVLLIGAAMVLQNTIVTRLQMLEGAADLVMLVLVSWVMQADEDHYWQWGLLAGLLVGVSSEIPVWVTVAGYVIFTLVISWGRLRIWQVPIWLLVTSTFFGTFLIYGIEVAYLWLIGVPLDLGEVLNIVLLPSLVLNMIGVLPVYFLIGVITKRIYPKEVEV